MFYQLPPVGNPVCLSRGDAGNPLSQDIFHPYVPKYYASGTAALAASITAAIRIKGVADPEVILPAYGCPDLVSAAVFAGAKPVLVDLARDRPWMDIDELSSRLNTNTVAIVAVSLFGIPERMETLRQVSDRQGVLLIEDSAQAFPGEPGDGFWSGDLVILSFGRGKPVSLLGGGAVLFQDAGIGGQLTGVGDSPAGPLRMRLLSRIYNLMISPRLYWIPQCLPFLHLGETRYLPLSGIAPMAQSTLELLERNIYIYQNDKPVNQARMSAMLNQIGVDTGLLMNLPALCRAPDALRLLRYPLLVDPGRRDRCLCLLKRAGLGPSRMYPAAFPGIRGLERLLSGQGDFPVAEDFARRILTLPTHRRVSFADIDKMGLILDSCLH